MKNKKEQQTLKNEVLEYLDASVDEVIAKMKQRNKKQG